MSERNIDADEVAKFQQLAQRWWDEEGEFAPLHAINPLRMSYIEERADLNGKRVLDIGCGGGILTEALARQGAQVTGIDVAEGPLGVARLHLHESGLDIDYRLCTVEEHCDDICDSQGEAQPAQYDVITCLEMLEHVPDPLSVIRSARKLIRDDGHLFLSTINRNLKSYLFAIIGAEHLLKLLPKGTHDYEKLIKPSELDAACRQAGFRVEDLTGMTYNPLTKVYRLGRDIDVNYLAWARPS